MLIYAIIVTLLLVGTALVGLIGWKRYYGYIDFFNRQRNRYRYMLRVYDMWTYAGQKGLSMSEYLIAKNETKIAIHGLDIMGVRIYEGLKNSEIEVIYGIQNKTEGVPTDLTVIDEKDCPNLEGISVIVTDYFDFYEIEKRLMEKGAKKIYSLDEILTNMIIEDQGNLGDIGYGY